MSDKVLALRGRHSFRHRLRSYDHQHRFLPSSSPRACFFHIDFPVLHATARTFDDDTPQRDGMTASHRRHLEDLAPRPASHSGDEDDGELYIGNDLSLRQESVCNEDVQTAPAATTAGPRQRGGRAFDDVPPPVTTGMTASQKKKSEKDFRKAKNWLAQS